MTDVPKHDDDPAALGEPDRLDRTLEDAEGGVEGSLLDAPEGEDDVPT